MLSCAPNKNYLLEPVNRQVYAKVVDEEMQLFIKKQRRPAGNETYIRNKYRRDVREGL